ncbi:MAG: CRTAC1 family protein [Acidobacteriaceae bacterium]|nr:CRTAC1 family protein [Acidobacteriaceae bacterium]
MNFNRRDFLGLGATALGASTLLSKRAHASGDSGLFIEVPPSASGIEFVHENAMSPDRYLPETMGPGVAFLDYDNDGWMDIYIVNSGPCDIWQPKKPIRNALYKNNRDGTFVDVTEKAGVAGGTFAMGVAVGDYDNDGWPDIFVTSYGNCILYKNNHDGTFRDVTKSAGLTCPGWTTSAVWFDYDGDGRLDLFVCSFVDYSGSHKYGCGDNKLGKHFYCIPRVFKGTPSFLFHNNGDGTFTDVTKGTDIEKAIGKGLGVVATDINNDGRMDLFVANDTVQNFLFVNRGPAPDGKWKWEECGLQAEVAFSDNGRPRSGMGVDAADLNNDGYEDLFVANVDQEMFSVYQNNKDESFRDVAFANGVAQATRLLSGWGMKYLDYDNDGRVDLILANGHPDDMINQYSLQVTYQEPLLLFHQEEDGKLHNVSDQGGTAFKKLFPARGLAVGDYNNDGALDVIIANNGGRPVLLKNNAASGNKWLGVKLQGVTCNRDAIGARLIWTAGDKRYSRLKNNGGSYLSSHDLREVLGIGKAAKIDELEIHWPAPSTGVEKLTNPPLNRYIKVVEGKGIVE